MSKTIQLIAELKNLCETQFKLLNTSIERIEAKCDRLEKMSSFSSSENSVLNVTPCYTIIETYIQEKIVVEKKHVIQILNNSNTIYNIVIDILCEHNQNVFQEHNSYIFYPMKETIFIWNEDIKTWKKITPAELKNIFNIIHQKITKMYAYLLQSEDEDLMGLDLIECSSNLYTDDFERKARDFKKKLFKQLKS